MRFYTIIIELGNSGRNRQPQAEETFGCVIRLVEMQKGTRRAFTLYEGQEPAYTLDEGEVNELHRLLEQIKMQAPWDAAVGCDGAICTLRLVGPMSHAEFNWWVKAPKGWESIGAVFDYVMSLAKRHGYAPALCG